MGAKTPTSDPERSKSALRAARGPVSDRKTIQLQIVNLASQSGQALLGASVASKRRQVGPKHRRRPELPFRVKVEVGT